MAGMLQVLTYMLAVYLVFKCIEIFQIALMSNRGDRRLGLRQLEIATRLEDLRVPPGNRLESLKGDRAGQHSIRINDQFRVCFRWTDTGPEGVEIVDYH